METGLSIRNNQSEITQIIQDSNNMYLSVLHEVGLPADNVLSSIDERKIAIANLPFVIDKINNELIKESYYLSKFFVAVATGLFDAALNYLWDETIKQLRIRVINGDIKYFYDVVISDDRRKQFTLPEDLLKLDKISEETRLLGRENISTDKQLFSYKDSVSSKLEILTKERKELRNYLRRNINDEDKEVIKESISNITSKIKVLRKDIALCDSIAERSKIIEERVSQIHIDETKKSSKKGDKIR